MENNASITIRCDKQFKERLEQFAKSKDLTVSQLVRRHFRDSSPALTPTGPKRSLRGKASRKGKGAA